MAALTLLNGEGDANGHQQQQPMETGPSSAFPVAAPSKPEPVPAAATHTHTRAIGIIHPPPDILVIIEKTVQFIARNGPESERRVVFHNQGKPKFSFLQPSDPHHAYYQHRISEIAHLQPLSSFVNLSIN